MPFSSGNYSAPSSPGSFNPAISGQPATASSWNTLLADIATALSTAILKDGTQTITQNIPFNGKKITGLGPGTASTDAATTGQIVDGANTGANDTGVADAYVIAPGIAITSYAAYQSFQFKAANTNTGASTLAVSSLAVKSIKHIDGTALLAGDIVAGEIVDVTYDGTNFQLLSSSGMRGTANTWRAAQTLAALTTMSGAAFNEAKGANIASATTTDIGAATGNFAHITGTTTITGLGTIQAGTRRVVVFDGVLTLTHNGTSLILPTGASITTAAGDTAEFESEGSGNWRCTSYQRASGASLVPYVPPQTAQAYVTIAAGVATVEKQTGFTSVVRTTAGQYECTLSTAMPDLNYVVDFTCGSDASGGSIDFEYLAVPRTTTVFHLGTSNNLGFADCNSLNIKVFA